MHTSNKYQNSVETSINYANSKGRNAKVGPDSILSFISKPHKESCLVSKNSQNDSVLSKAETCDDLMEIRSLIDFFQDATDENTQLKQMRRPAPFKRMTFFSKLENGSLSINKSFMDLNIGFLGMANGKRTNLFHSSTKGLNLKIARRLKKTAKKLRPTLDKNLKKCCILQDNMLTADLF